MNVVISGTGFSHPEEIVTNTELVSAYNKYVDLHNKENSHNILLGNIEPLRHSSVEFIEEASGIKRRCVRDKQGLLNPNRMAPFIAEREDGEVSIQAEECLKAARAALHNANKNPKDIDVVIMSSSHKQRDFPSVSIEVQKELGTKGYAFDMGVACASATFGVNVATSLINTGTVSSVLLVSPEIKSGQFSAKCRDSHFIFGEATSAVIIENESISRSEHCYKIIDISLDTKFSNNIRNNRGAYNNCSPDTMLLRDKFFYQNGRRVFKEVTQLVSDHLKQHLDKNLIDICEISRYWFHHARRRDSWCGGGHPRTLHADSAGDRGRFQVPGSGGEGTRMVSSRL